MTKAGFSHSAEAEKQTEKSLTFDQIPKPNVEIFWNCYPSVVFVVLILFLLIRLDILRNSILLPIRGGVIEDEKKW